jgi:tetratricopeptide (TPR) repeat protein
MKLFNHTPMRTLFTTGIALAAAVAAHAQTQQDGKEAYNRQEYDKAKMIFSSLIKNQPGEASNYFYLGNVYVQNDKEDSAKYYFDKGIAANANEPLNYVGLGELRILAKDYSGGRAQFDKALQLSNNKNAEVMYQISAAHFYAQDVKDADYSFNLAKKAADMDKKNLYYAVNYADALRLKGEGGQGLTEYQHIAAANPKFPFAQLRIGEFLTKLTNYTDALAAYNQVISIDPNYPPVYKDLGEYYFKTGKLNDAIESYKKFLALVGTSPSERVRYASFLYVMKNYKDAAAELDKVLPRDPNNVLMLRLLAYSDYELGNYQKGLDEMKKYFATIKPDRVIPQDYVYYGRLLSKTGSDSLAIVNLYKGLQQDTTATDLYDVIAESYAKQKRYADAAKVVETKIAKTKANVNAQDYFTLAYDYYLAKDYVKADTNFAMVNKYFPTYAVGYLLRAKTKANLDPDVKQGLAKPYYEKFIELAKDDPNRKTDLANAYYYLAVYYYNRKDNVKAKENAEKAKEYDPGNQQVLDILKFLSRSK